MLIGACDPMFYLIRGGAVRLFRYMFHTPEDIDWFKCGNFDIILDRFVPISWPDRPTNPCMTHT